MRGMVGDEQDVFRVVVVRGKCELNPEYRQRGEGSPCIYTDETYETSYGPYNTIGAARSIQTRETRCGPKGPFRQGVVDTWIEKATTTWEKVA